MASHLKLMHAAAEADLSEADRAIVTKYTDKSMKIINLSFGSALISSLAYVYMSMNSSSKFKSGSKVYAAAMFACPMLLLYCGNHASKLLVAREYGKMIESVGDRDVLLLAMDGEYKVFCKSL